MPVVTCCSTEDRLIPEADYVLIRMIQPLGWLQSAPEGGHTIGHYLPMRDVKGKVRGKNINITYKITSNLITYLTTLTTFYLEHP